MRNGKHATTTGLTVRPLVVEVKSLTDPSKTYTVQIPHCTCPDFQFRDRQDETHLCKHIRRVYEMMASWRQVEV